MKGTECLDYPSYSFPRKDALFSWVYLLLIWLFINEIMRSVETCNVTILIRLACGSCLCKYSYTDCIILKVTAIFSLKVVGDYISVSDTILETLYPCTLSLSLSLSYISFCIPCPFK
jgi:hypothetical protein